MHNRWRANGDGRLFSKGPFFDNAKGGGRFWAMRKNSQSPKPPPNTTIPASTVDGVRIPISSDIDIVKARQEGRKIAAQAGFAFTELALVATAISELARNIVRYARKGEIAIQPVANSTRRGIQIVAQDQGPGIRDVEQALQIGFSTSGGLGLGLPGVRRLMDEFDIQSELGRGTTVRIAKWRH
jgi:serine/threonine-protein kinase RsbT